MRRTGNLLVGVALALAFVLTTGAGAAVAAEPQSSEGIGAIEVIRVEPWRLVHSDGHQLYSQLCESCHGSLGVGMGSAARVLKIPAPPLNNLEQRGVSQYRLMAVLDQDVRGCDGAHQWNQRTTAEPISMPCWSEILGDSLHHFGDDRAVLVVNRRLVDYIASIQE